MEEKVYFDNGAGTKLCGILNMPRKDSPVVILCHGFASKSENGLLRGVARGLADFRIGSFRFDFSGHGASGGLFADITLTRAIGDLHAAHALISGRSQHIGLFGISFGGGVCFHTSASLGEAAVLVCPALLHYRRKWSRLTPFGRLWWRMKGEVSYKKHDGTKLPLRYSFCKDTACYDARAVAATINVPILIIHGDADRTIRYNDSVEMVQKLSSARLVTATGVDHYFRDPAATHLVVAETVAFFRKIFVEPLDKPPQRLRTRKPSRR